MFQPKTVYELVGVSKEKLEELIPHLIPSHQEFLRTHYDKDYNKIKKIIWTSNEIYTYHSSIIKRLRNLATRDLNCGHNLRKSFLELSGISKEEFYKNLPRFKKNIQDFFYSHFNENLEFTSCFDCWPLEERDFYYNTFIYYVKRFTDSSRTQYSLCNRVNTTKDILDVIVPMLSEQSQDILRRHFTKDYKPIHNIEWDLAESNHLHKHIIPRIKDILAGYAKRSQMVSYNNLPNKMGITKYQFKYILNLLPVDAQEFVIAKYDDNFILKDGIELNSDDKKFINLYILGRMRRKLIKSGFVQINEENIIKNNQRIMDEAYLAVTKPTSQSMPYEFYVELVKNNETLSSFRKIEILKQLQQSFIEFNNKSEEEIKLTRKKN